MHKHPNIIRDVEPVPPTSEQIKIISPPKINTIIPVNSNILQSLFSVYAKLV